MKIRGFWISPYWTRILLLSGLTIGLMWFILSCTKIYINRSDSSPHKAFICTDIMSVSYGDYVSIEGHDTTYFKGNHFTKKLVGLPGDIIEVREGHVYVNHRPVGPLLSNTTQGLQLTPIAVSRIPEGFAFVAGDHPRSFDSRYQEFGLIKADSIKGSCFGIGVRKADEL